MVSSGLWGCPLPGRSPQEIDMLNPLPMALRGTLVSIEPKPQCPPDNTAAMRGLLSLERSVETSIWSNPAINSLQGTEFFYSKHTQGQPREADSSSKPSGSLATQYTTNISQFGSCLPKFNGVLPTVVGPEQCFWNKLPTLPLIFIIF